MVFLMAAAALAAFLLVCAWRRGRRKKRGSAGQEEICNGDDELLDGGEEDRKPVLEKDSRLLAWRVLLGVAVCIGGFQAPWQALPVLVDRKIARDPALPLGDVQLKISETFIFVGWLLGAILLHPLMHRLDLKQVVVLLSVTMLAVCLAAISLPYFTPLSMTLLCGVRLVHGICLNLQGVQYMFMQSCFPGYGSQLCALSNTLYAAVAVLMAVLCGTLTLHTDWRIELLLWLGLPMILGLLLAFPDLGTVVGSLPEALLRPVRHSHVSGLEKAEVTTHAVHQDLACLTVCFAATVFSFYGLAYSADSLSTNPFLSSQLMSGADVIACMVASRASSIGRNRAQTWGCVVAGTSMIACAFGTVDSVAVLTMAMLARMALSVVAVTMYVALAEVFPPWCQKTALPACEIMARVGGCLSPSCGSLPVHLSLPLFGSACLLAARATTKLPDKYAPKEL